MKNMIKKMGKQKKQKKKIFDIIEPDIKIDIKNEENKIDINQVQNDNINVNNINQENNNDDFNNNEEIKIEKKNKVLKRKKE